MGIKVINEFIKKETENAFPGGWFHKSLNLEAKHNYLRV